MKKYIFTESQIKKIIDSQLNEQHTKNPVGGGVTSSISQFIISNSLYANNKQLINKLRSLTYTVLTVDGKPTKGNMLITKGMVIKPNDLITLKPNSGNPRSLVYDGDRLLLASTKNSGTQINLNVENGKLYGHLQGA